MDELKTILHGEPKSDKEVMEEKYTSHYQQLRYLHEQTEDRLVELEDAINQNKPDPIPSIAALKLELELKKVLQTAKDMKKMIRDQRDNTYRLFAATKKIEEAREQRKQHLKDKMGEEEAEKLIQTIEESKKPNEKWIEAQETIKKSYRKCMQWTLNSWAM